MTTSPTAAICECVRAIQTLVRGRAMLVVELAHETGSAATAATGEDLDAVAYVVARTERRRAVMVHGRDPLTVACVAAAT